MHRLSLVVVNGVCSLVAVHGLLAAVACFGAQALEHMRLSSRARVQRLWCTGLVTLRHVGSSQTKDQTCVPASAGEFLTTKEVL